MKSFYPFVKPLHSNAFNPDRRSHIEVKDVYAGTRWFLKKLYKEYDNNTFRLMYVNFLDFLENEKNIPIDSLTFSLFTVYSYIFSSIGESFYKELKDRFDKPKIFSEGFRFYSLGDLLLGMFDICLEFSKRLNEKRISSLIMNISNVGVSFYKECRKTQPLVGWDVRHLPCFLFFDIFFNRFCTYISRCSIKCAVRPQSRTPKMFLF